jgi:hypothetical protein
MTEALPSLPESCTRTLAAVQADPLDPGAESEVHMKTCRACSEARITYLAQEPFAEALAPAGYFDRLPDRVLRKLPARPALLHRIRPFTWAVAAALLMAVGTGAFWAGRANRTPLVEASLPRPLEVQEDLPDTPFLESEDAVAQLSTLSPEEAEAIIRSLADKQAHPPVRK